MFRQTEQSKPPLQQFSPTSTEIGALEAKVAKARRIKQAMMQELLTGRIRLV